MTSGVYPVGLVVEGRPCLVVGSGPAAAGKVAGLLACGARVTLVASEPPETVAAHPMLKVEARDYIRGEAASYRLAVAASTDPAVNAAVFEDGEAAGVWVNSPDQPAICSFLAPAVIRRSPLVLTVTTGGESPALASWLRRHLEDLLGGGLDDLGELAAALGRARAELRAAGASLDGQAWTELVERAAPLAGSGRLDEALGLLEDWVGRRSRP